MRHSGAATIGGEATEPRFYGELAAWWPLISPPDEYVDDAAQVAAVFESASIPVRSVLELGSGGGHSAVHLKSRYAMTLVDLSEAMLAVSRRLNPECEHLAGDMRTLRLGRRFDAVLIHDAVEYMTSEHELRQALKTAFVHCRPGGVAMFMPDYVVETFEPSTDHGGTDAADGRGARYLEWTWDPDPADSWVQTEYAFVLRDPQGRVRVVHDTHRTGLFARPLWLRLLAETGFEARSLGEHHADGWVPREFFVGRCPAGAPDT